MIATQLNNLLGTFLPANSQWQPVIDGLVSKLVTGGLNTAPQRLAAIQGIASTLNATAAAQRSQ